MVQSPNIKKYITSEEASEISAELSKKRSREVFSYFVCKFLRYLSLPSWRTSKMGHSKIASFGTYLRVGTYYRKGWSTSQK